MPKEHICKIWLDRPFIARMTRAWAPEHFSQIVDVNDPVIHKHIPDVARVALQITPSSSLADARQIFIYTDGTGGCKADGEDTPPAWSFVVLAQLADSEYGFVGFVADQLANGGQTAASMTLNNNSAGPVFLL
jgi:hypothetical protein